MNILVEERYAGAVKNKQTSETETGYTTILKARCSLSNLTKIQVRIQRRDNYFPAQFMISNVIYCRFPLIRK